MMKGMGQGRERVLGRGGLVMSGEKVPRQCSQYLLNQATCQLYGSNSQLSLVPFLSPVCL